MKILVLSDIHGHAGRLRDALRIYATAGATHIFLTGDLLGGRPFSRGTDERATAAILSAYAPCITAVKGNCDTAFDERRTGLRLPVYDWCELGGKTFFLTHGHSCKHPMGGDGKKPDFVLTGHTHIPSLARTDGTVWLNPGSVAFPRGGADCTCALITDEAVQILRVDDGSVLQELSLGA